MLSKRFHLRLNGLHVFLQLLFYLILKFLIILSFDLLLRQLIGLLQIILKPLNLNLEVVERVDQKLEGLLLDGVEFNLNDVREDFHFSDFVLILDAVFEIVHVDEELFLDFDLGLQILLVLVTLLFHVCDLLSKSVNSCLQII